MTRQLFLTLLACSLGGLYGCAATTLVPTQNATTASMASAEEPCWVKRPNCLAKGEDTALYFVGQSAQPLANWGRPERASTQSAQTDAEQQYARFLGVEITSSVYLQSLLEDERYQSQFSHTVTSNVDRTVSDLVKVDEYFVAYQQTTEGQPLWTVYVLIKVSKESVDTHRVAVAEEAKRRANAPPPPDEWTAKVFNIDDSATIYVNGTKISECGFSDTCTVGLGPHFEPGANHVRIDFGNRLGFWTYGYEVHKNDELMYEGSCGQVWVFGCSWDTTIGVAHSFEFQVEKS